MPDTAPSMKLTFEGAQKLLDAGFSADEVRTMAVTNPTALIEA